MKNLMGKIPKEGFIRTTLPSAPKLDSAQKAGLNRKGNEFFNMGRIQEAQKIFISTRYNDGLTRLGDFYYKKHDYISALEMYTLASNSQKKEALLKQYAEILRNWLLTDS